MIAREATVQSHYQQRSYGEVKEVSQIRMTGKWLLDAGFTPQTKVYIEVSNGEIKISKK